MKSITDCPGGWYGVEATPTYPGHVVIDPAQVESALKYFRRRGKKPIVSQVTDDKGLLIRFLIQDKCPVCGTIKEQYESCPAGCVPDDHAVGGADAPGLLPCLTKRFDPDDSQFGGAK